MGRGKGEEILEKLYALMESDTGLHRGRCETMRGRVVAQTFHRRAYPM